MSSTYGKNIKISVFGQSHSAAIGVTVDGLPSGFRIDTEALQVFMERRAPGRNAHSTQRREEDLPEFLSGLTDGRTCGAPLAAIIRNKDTRSNDYNELRDKPRPGHADFTAQLKFKGAQDVRGGGHFSGRLTAPLCIAGGICLQMLEARGVYIAAHIAQIGRVKDTLFNPTTVTALNFNGLKEASFPVLNEAQGQSMQSEIDAAKNDGDSLGGVIECAAVGMPGGLGEPMFDGIENKIAGLVFGVPAVKGIEFGNGFQAASLRGSENNDSFYMHEGTIKTRTNNHGGILGGITSGMPIIFRAAIKPTPSISQAQQSVSFTDGKDALLAVKGRHDPCIVPRAVPVIEAVTAIALLDAYLDYEKYL